jgi:hypothetical protein
MKRLKKGYVREKRLGTAALYSCAIIHGIREIREQYTCSKHVLLYHILHLP